MSAHIKTWQERMAEMPASDPLNAANAEIADLRAALQAQQGEAKDAQQPATNDTHRHVVEMLLEVARLAFDAMDNTEENDTGLHWNSDNFDALSAAMDELEALPDDQPGYVMGPSAKAEWALRNTVTPAVAQDAKAAPAPATLSDEQIDVLIKAHSKTAPRNDGDGVYYVDVFDKKAFARALLAAAGSSQVQDGKRLDFIFDHLSVALLADWCGVPLPDDPNLRGLGKWGRYAIDAALAAKEAGHG